MGLGDQVTPTLTSQRFVTHEYKYYCMLLIKQFVLHKILFHSRSTWISKQYFWNQWNCFGQQIFLLFIVFGSFTFASAQWLLHNQILNKEIIQYTSLSVNDYKNFRYYLFIQVKTMLFIQELKCEINVVDMAWCYAEYPYSNDAYHLPWRLVNHSMFR